MRRVAILLVTAMLAGCLSDSGDGDGRQTSQQAVWSAHGAVEPAEFAWGLQLCDHGYRVVAAAGETSLPHHRQCDFRVTKPLQDPGRFDWTTQHGPGNEVSMAVNPTDPLNLIGGAKDYTVSYISDTADCGEFTVWNGHFASYDGGRTWTNDLIPGFPGDPRPSPLKGNLCNTDPVSVFDSDGTYWHNGLNYRGTRDDTPDPMNPAGNGGLVTGSQIFFARSQDKGATFDRITFASYGQNDPGIFNDKNWLAVDPDSDHMIHTWTNFYGFVPVIEYVESFDGGLTWTHPTPFDPGVTPMGNTGVTVPTGQFSMPQYDSSGNIWVIWSSGGGPVITFAERLADGQPAVFAPAIKTFQYGGGLRGGGCLPKTEFRASVYPVLAIDTSGGPFNDHKYIAYPAEGPDGTADVWLARSDDGLNWGSPERLTGMLDDDQFMSWIDVGPDGTVHVAYYDCSVGGERDMTMSWMWSDDGAVTWNGPFNIGQVPFDGDLGHHQSGVPFIGDYNAVDASDKAVHFFWADTRNGRSDVYAATVVKDWKDHALYAPELAEA